MELSFLHGAPVILNAQSSWICSQFCGHSAGRQLGSQSTNMAESDYLGFGLILVPQGGDGVWIMAWELTGIPAPTLRSYVTLGMSNSL
jgi:hypothetical protein